MPRLTDLTRSILLPALAATSLACETGYKQLDATDTSAETDSETGAETGELACLLGTNLDTVGTMQETWAGVCEPFTCDPGWGAAADPLEIEWTNRLTSVRPGPVAAPMEVRDGALYVGISNWFESTFWVARVDVDTGEELGLTQVPIDDEIFTYQIARAEDAHFLNYEYFTSEGTHSAVSRIDTQARVLWTRDLGPRSLAVAAEGEHLALLLMQEGEPSTVELADLDGATLWTIEGSDRAYNIGIVDGGVAVLSRGGLTIYDAADGSVLESMELSPGWAMADVSTDGGAITLVGSGDGDGRLDGVVTRLDGNAQVWTRSYNRLLDSCETPVDEPGSSESFVAAVSLADHTTLVLGHDELEHRNGEWVDALWGQAWVGLVDEHGALVQFDRIIEGSSFALDALEGPQGEIYMVGLAAAFELEGPPDEVLVRKYRRESNQHG